VSSWVDDILKGGEEMEEVCWGSDVLSGCKMIYYLWPRTLVSNLQSGNNTRCGLADESAKKRVFWIIASVLRRVAAKPLRVSRAAY